MILIILLFSVFEMHDFFVKTNSAALELNTRCHITILMAWCICTSGFKCVYMLNET